MNRKSLYDRIGAEIKKVGSIQPTQNHAKIAMRALDLTSLSGDDTENNIQALAVKAKSVDGYEPAALCVFPEFLNLLNDFNTATVALFPLGKAESLNQIKNEIEYALSQNADEIDYVADYSAYMSMEVGAQEKICKEIQTAKTASRNKPLKVILESAAFGQLDELYDFATLAIENGADFIKTSTGKHEDGGATLEAVATMAMSIADHYHLTGKHVGLKISGGVNGKNYAQYIGLVENMLGKDFVSNPQTFRIGASGLFDDLKLSLGQNQPMIPQQQKTNATLGY